MPKSVREVLDIIWSRGVLYGIEGGTEYNSTIIAEALKALREIIESKRMPMGKERSMLSAYNDALDDILKEFV